IKYFFIGKTKLVGNPLPQPALTHYQPAKTQQRSNAQMPCEVEVRGRGVFILSTTRASAGRDLLGSVSISSLGGVTRRNCPCGRPDRLIRPARFRLNSARASTSTGE